MEPHAGGRLEPDSLAEGIARILRHEVGDLLQSIYATVAVLQGRLDPDLSLEQRLLAGLRNRAEVCRLTLDAVHDLVRPPAPNPAPVDLAELTRQLVAAVAERHSICLEVLLDGPVPLNADAALLHQTGELLLLTACQSAQKHVVIQARALPDRVEWAITDDGPGASPEQLAWLTQPFARTRQGLSGLALAVAQQTARAHGGGLTVESPAEGGCQVRLSLPAAAFDAGA
jgi:signal transduction histidine kinase